MRYVMFIILMCNNNTPLRFELHTPDLQAAYMYLFRIKRDGAPLGCTVEKVTIKREKGE